MAGSPKLRRLLTYVVHQRLESLALDRVGQLNGMAAAAILHGDRVLPVVCGPTPAADSRRQIEELRGVDEMPKLSGLRLGELRGVNSHRLAQARKIGDTAVDLKLDAHSHLQLGFQGFGCPRRRDDDPDLAPGLSNGLLLGTPHAI